MKKLATLTLCFLFLLTTLTTPYRNEVHAVETGAPVISSLTINRTSVSNGQTATVKLNGYDPEGALRVGYGTEIIYMSPTGELKSFYFKEINQSYYATIEFEPYDAVGVWKVHSVIAEDDEFLSTILYNSALSEFRSPSADLSHLNVTYVNTYGDTTSPTILSLSITNPSLRQYESSMIVVMASDLGGSGLFSGNVIYRSPSGIEKNVKLENRGGFMTGFFNTDQSEESGTWRVVSVQIKDLSNNSYTLYNNQVDATKSPSSNLSHLNIDHTATWIIDNVDPIVSNIAINRTSGSIGDEVQLTLDVSDSDSGICYGLVWLFDSENNYLYDVLLLPSGNQLVGNYKLGPNEQSKTVVIGSIRVYDSAYNSYVIDNSQNDSYAYDSDIVMDLSYLNYTLTNPDFNPTSPKVSGISIEKSTIQPNELNKLTLNITYPGSVGIESGYLSFKSPSGEIWKDVRITKEGNTWISYLDFNPNEEPGKWSLSYISLFLDNSNYFSCNMADSPDDEDYCFDLSTINVTLTNTIPDTTAPIVINSTVDVTSININESAWFKVWGSDGSGTGISYGFVEYIHESGNQWTDYYFNSRGGHFDAGINMDQTFRPGIWSINRIKLCDGAFNCGYLYNSNNYGPEKQPQADLSYLDLTFTNPEYDVTPPVIGTTTVDLNTATPNTTVNYHVNIEEIGSGINFANISLLSPNGGDYETLYLEKQTDGSYLASKTFTSSDLNGTWKVESIVAYDNNSNSLRIYNFDVVGGERDNTVDLSHLNVVLSGASDLDVIAPTITSISVNKNTARPGETITFTVNATDNSNSELNGILYFGLLDSVYSREVELTWNNGVLTGSTTLLASDPNGIWSVSEVYIYDQSDNVYYLTNSDYYGTNYPPFMDMSNLNVTFSGGTAPDNNYPVITSLTINRNTLRVGEKALITLTGTDIGSGVDSAYVYYYLPGYDAIKGKELIYANGSFTAEFSFDETDEFGTWVLLGVELYDAFGNATVWLNEKYYGVNFQGRHNLDYMALTYVDGTADTTPPIVQGVQDGKAYNTNVTITFNEGSAKLNNVAFNNGSTVSAAGSYTLVVTDAALNTTTVRFTIDKTAPIISGLTQSVYIGITPVITFNEGTATINGFELLNGLQASGAGDYVIVVTDSAGNTTTKSFKIIEQIATPTNFKIGSVDYASIGLVWDANPKVAGFELTRSTTATGTYSLVGYYTASEFNNTGLAFNTSYYYKLRAYVLVDNVKYYSASTSAITAKTALKTPGITPVSSGYDRITVSWPAISGANGYEVYQSTSTAGVYTLLATTASTSYTKTALVTNTSYFYKVRAYRLVGTIKVYSGYSTIVSAKPIPATPVVTVTSAGYNSVKASWVAIAGASGYEISYSLSEDGTYTLLPHQTATTYTLINQATNQPVFFKVRAYRLVGTLKVFGDTSVVKSASPIPSTPVVSVASPSFNSLRVSWATVAGASGYELYHLNSSTGLYDLLHDGTDLFYLHTELTSGMNHSYKVKAYTLVEETKVYSLDSAVVSNKAIPSVPTLPKAVFANYNSITVSYDAVEGATGYEIYRSTAAAGVYALVTTTSSLSYTNTSLAFNTLYYYKVRAYTLVDNVKVYGNYTAVVSARTSVNTPVITPVSSGYDRITVSWPAISGANGYEVYQSTSTAGVYTLLATTATASYTKTALVTNTSYFYKVRAYRLVGTVKVYSGYSTIVSAKPIPATPVVTVASAGYNSVKASWAAIAGASGYEISYSLSEDGTFTLLPHQTGTSYTLANQTTNQPVFFKVRAYRMVGTLKVFGDTSVVKSASPIPSTPVVSVVSPSFNSLRVSWAAIAGASGYELYHLNSSTGLYDLLHDGTELFYLHSDLVSGINHSYKVKAYTLVEETKVYSLDSAVTSNKAIPSIPTLPKAVFANYNSITVSFNEVEGATGYEIYRSTAAAGVYALVTTTSSLSYVNTGLAFNTVYYYKVRAYTLVDTVKVYGNYTAVVSARTSVNTPVITPVSSGYDRITVSWPAISGANGYEVYQSTSTAGVYTLLATTASTSYTKTALVTNTSYYYKIRAYRLVGTIKVYSGYSTIVSAKPIPATPVVTVASAGFNSVKASWAAIAGASGYELSYSLSEDGTYTLLPHQTATTYTLANQTTNQPVFFKVRAYRMVGTLKVFGNTSVVKSASPIPSTPVISVASLSYNSLRVSWASIAGASGYELYHLNTGTGLYELLQDGTDLFYVHSDLISNVNHSYKVKAYTLVGETKIYSLDSSGVTNKPIPSIPALAKAVFANYNSITVSYDAVEGAVGYEIYRSATSTGVYTLLTTTSSLSYTNTGLAFNTLYYYKVRAYTLVDNVKVYGNYTAVLSARTSVNTPVITPVSSGYDRITVSWPAITGANGYEVYQSTSTAGVYTLLATTASTSYTKTALVTNTSYYYKVRAYRLVGTVKVYSGYSTIVSAKPVPAVPVVSVYSVAFNSVKASWPAVAGATGYEVSYSLDPNGTFTTLPTQTATSYILSNVATNELAYFKVRAYRLVGTLKVFGNSSNLASGKPIPATPVVSVASYSYNTLRVSWPAITGATGYELYHLNSSTGLYELLHDGSDAFYLHSDLISNVNHSYKVKAYTLVGETKVYSLDSAVVTNKPIPSVPTSASAVFANYNSITVSYNAVEGAVGYEIYRSATSTGVYTLLTTTTGLSYTNASLAFNTLYYYKVRAYTLVNNLKVYGNYTAILSARTMVNTPVITPVSSGYDRITVSWPAIAGISGYEVYQSTSSAGVYTLLTTTTATSYTKTGLVTGTNYFYKTRAYRLVGTVKVYGGYSAIMSASPKLGVANVTSVIGTSNNGEVSVTLQAVTGASGYEVQYSTSEDFATYGTKTLTTLTGTVTGLTLETQYFFRVRAYRQVTTTTKVFGEVGESKSFMVKTMVGLWEGTLTAGHYTVGIDLPAGTYNLSLVSGSGNVMSDNYDFINGINEIFSNDPIFSGITTYNNLNLTDGDVLTITSNLSIALISQNAKLYQLKTRVQPNVATYLFASGNYTSGVDFVWGTYDIRWISGDGNVYNDSIYDGGINEIFGENSYVSSIKSFENVELKSGSVLHISGCVVELVPSR